MKLREKIDQDFKLALKNKDTLRISVYRFLKANLTNHAISKKLKELEDPDVIEVVTKLIKQHQESIAGFQQGGREELVAKETQEMEILKAYAPPPLSDEALRTLIQKAVQECQAQGPQDLGKVMKVVVPQTKGKADGQRVSQLVRDVLSGT